MNIQEIVERVESLFPDLKPRELETEAERRSFLTQFFVLFLREFNVDVDSISKVQIDQPEIAFGNEMIQCVNLCSSINTLIPNFKITIFDLISPQPKAIWHKIKLAFDYYDYCDEVISKIYDICNPYEEKKESISQLKKQKSKLEENILNAKVKIDHTNKLIEEANADCSNVNASSQDMLGKKLAIEIQLQQIITNKAVSMRKKNELSALLKESKSKMEKKRHNLLNLSVDCDNQLKKLEDELAVVTEQYKLLTKKKEDQDQELSECNKLKELSEQRLCTANKIVDCISKFKELEIKSSQLSKNSNDDVNDFDLEISNQLMENKKLEKIRNQQIVTLENIIARHNSQYEFNKSKLVTTKSNYKNLDEIKIKLKEIDIKVEKIKESFILEEKKLKDVRIARINAAKKEFKRNEKVQEVLQVFKDYQIQ